MIRFAITIDLSPLRDATPAEIGTFNRFMDRVQRWGLDQIWLDGKEYLVGEITGENNWGSFMDQLMVLSLAQTLYNRPDHEIVTAVQIAQAA